MESASKLPLPRGRGNANLRPKPLKPNTDANLPTFPKMVLRKRSLSCTELNANPSLSLEKKNAPATILKPVKTREVKKTQPLVPRRPPMKSNTDDNIPPAARAALRRRSKSCLNLKSAYFPNKVTLNPVIARNAIKPTALKTTTIPAKSTLKRSAGDASNDVKQAKQPKLAAWDHKGRLMQLQEKHTLLQNSLKEYKEKTKGKTTLKWI